MVKKKTTKKKVTKKTSTKSSSKRSKTIRSIGVLTSGGDSPGMNAAIRAVVRTAIGNGLEAYGIYRGYQGLLEGDIIPMELSSVGNIIQHGGTILKTSRCPEFFKKTIRKEAAHILKRKEIDGLVVIGGDGSFNGANLLYQETGLPVVGIPGTIDNDISGTEYTIGFDSAVQTAVEAVDRIRDTASSHDRIFLVEVMGRSSEALALHVGVCTGAENIVFPKSEVNYAEIVGDIKRGIKRGKNSSIVIVGEGPNPGRSYEIQKYLKSKFKMECHVCILGHTQRGGRPSAHDRFIASQMGHLAIHAFLQGIDPAVTVYQHGEVLLTPFKNCLERKIESKTELVELAKTLSI